RSEPPTKSGEKKPARKSCSKSPFFFLNFVQAVCGSSEKGPEIKLPEFLLRKPAARRKEGYTS
ncbi:MAG: hypothetical protein UHU21_12895, partial [Lachnospiraceae bacterium]|nr:hypothetical protein [Lachnospiraceae bacterium]